LSTAIAVCLLLCFGLGNASAQVSQEPPLRIDTLSAIKLMLKKEVYQSLKSELSNINTATIGIGSNTKDSIRIDSISAIIASEIRGLGKTGLKIIRSTTNGVVNNSKQLLQQQFNKVIQKPELREFINQLKGALRMPVLKWTGGSVIINGQIAPSLFDDGSVFVNNTVIASNWMVMGIPLSLQFQRQDFSNGNYSARNNFSFHFDRTDYFNSLRDKVKLKINAQDLMPNYKEGLDNLKVIFLNELKHSLDSVNQHYKGYLTGAIGEMGDLSNLMTVDIKTLENKLMNRDLLSQFEANKNQLVQLQGQIDMGSQVDQLKYDSVLRSVKSIQGVNDLIQTVLKFSKKIRSSGLLEKLQQFDEMKKGSIDEILKSPDRFKSLAKDQLNLNSIQKMFMSVNKLNIGLNVVSLSPLTVYQYANNGINAEFINNRSYFFVMAGKEKEFNSLFDRRFTSPLFANDNTALGIRIGKGALNESFTHLSVFNFVQNKSSYGGNTIVTAPSSTLVTTISHQIKVNANNFFFAEVSKSSRQYKEDNRLIDTLRLPQTGSKGIFNSQDFLQQMAVTVRWNGEVTDKNLTYSVHGTLLGKAYDNPGSLFLTRGMTEFGGSVKKSYLKNKLQFLAKGNYRKYSYGLGTSKFENHYFAFQGKWKFKKGQYLSLRYQPYQSARTDKERNYSVGGSDQLAMEINLQKRIKNVSYRNSISITGYNNHYSFDSLAVNNKSILLTSMQSITYKKHTYYVNLQYNKANATTAVALFNTQFMTDLGFMFRIGDKIMASTAVNYNSVQDWYRQVGIKQTISGQLTEKLQFSLYADVFKNIKVFRPSYMDNIRFEWTLQYFLK
jgi:hypothetical protein